ncbi:MAG: hypothetical protein V1793_16605 [Pseudomonadota bacterium]
MTNPSEKAYFERFEQLFSLMDAAWARTAEAFGFVCRGCGENCCETLFYHHTHMEQDYLLYGAGQMEQDVIARVLDRALNVVSLSGRTDPGVSPPRIMCPLNENGQCILYRFRPMICRMHGIPHVLHRPGAEPLPGPGCRAGEPLFRKPHIPVFDRTPHYTAMAALEMDYRKAFGKTGKVRLTISQILISGIGRLACKLPRKYGETEGMDI